MTTQNIGVVSTDTAGPLGLLLVDGPNVMIKVKELWEASDEERPQDFGLRYDAVAKYLCDKFGIDDGDFQKTIFIKRVSDSSPDGEEESSVDKQDKFRYALERDGWDVQVRAQADGTLYSDKVNDIDDDLIGLALAFIEEAETGDVLVIMTNDFNVSPDGKNTRKVLESAHRLGLRTAFVSFLPISPDLQRSKIEVIDSRDIPGAFRVPPPIPRTIADVAPGTIESFDRYAVKVVGRRGNKLPQADDSAESASRTSETTSLWTQRQPGSPQRVIPPPPGSTHPRRSVPAPPRPPSPTDLHQIVLDTPGVRSISYGK
ncbi:MAG: hypothetical protein U0516_00170 [Candidatus Saccharibacteria bacterium]